MWWDKFKGVFKEVFNRSPFYYTPASAIREIAQISEPRSSAENIVFTKGMPSVDELILLNLCPNFSMTIRSVLRDCREAGLSVMLTSGYRSFKEQDKLYAKGRTTAGKIVTKAKAGFSLHNYALAVDIVFVDEKGKPSWAEKWPWDQLGKIGKQHGLEWGGDWKMADRPHFQYFNGLKLRDAIKIYKAEGIKGVWSEVYK